MVRPNIRKFGEELTSDRESRRRGVTKKGPNGNSLFVGDAGPSLISSIARRTSEKTQIVAINDGDTSSNSACLRDVLDLILKLLNMHELKFAVTLIERLIKTKSAQSQLEMTMRDLSGLLTNVTKSEPDSELDYLVFQLDPGRHDKPSRLEGNRSRSPPAPPASLDGTFTQSTRSRSPNNMPSSMARMRIGTGGVPRSRPATASGPPSRPQSSPLVGSSNSAAFDQRPPSAQSHQFSRPPSAAGEPPPLPPLPLQLRDFSHVFVDDSAGIESMQDPFAPTVTTSSVEDITEDTAVRPASAKQVGMREELPNVNMPVNGTVEPQERWAHPPQNALKPVEDMENLNKDSVVKETRFRISMPPKDAADEESGPAAPRSAPSARTQWKNQVLKGSMWSKPWAKKSGSQEVVAKKLRRRQTSKIFTKEAEPESQYNTPMAGASNETWWAVPSHRFIISPNGVLRITWDMMSLIAITNEAVVVPLSLLFEMETPEPLFITSTAFFSIDLILNFLTGYFADGILVMKQAYIIWNYLRTWFPLDAASTFPWHVVFSGGNATMLKLAKFGKVMRVVRLLRVAKVSVLLEHVQDLFASPLLLVALKLGKIVCFIAMLCHWVACIWGALGHPDMHKGLDGQEHHDQSTCEPGGPCEPSIIGSAWRRRYGVEQDTKAEQYLLALRFSTGLFTGNDMGLQPGYWVERMFLIFMFFASMILGSTVISNIVMIFEGMRQERQEQDELMLSFKQFMATSQVPFQLQSKIKRYLDFQFKSRKELQVRRNELMNRLSPWLRKELQVHLNSNVLVQHRFFRDMPSEILDHICCLATSDITAPGDVIIQCGQNVHIIYFVVKGRLSVSMKGGGSSMQALRSSALGDEHAWQENNAQQPSNVPFTGGDERESVLSSPGWIGAASLFKDEVRPYTVASLANSELLKLAREDIDALLQEFPALGMYIEHYIESCDKEGFQDCSLPSISQACGEKPPESVVADVEL